MAHRKMPCRVAFAEDRADAPAAPTDGVPSIGLPVTGAWLAAGPRDMCNRDGKWRHALDLERRDEDRTGAPPIESRIRAGREVVLA